MKRSDAMPAFHWYDLLILGLIALLVFGPKRLPEMGAAVGKTIKEFQKSMREVTGGHDNAPAVPPAAPQVELSAPAATGAPTATSATSATSATGAPIDAPRAPETTTP